MPLTRYQIRNEYGLADPELYKAAEKDDPEALLEGVAMAGLVGVLRQLGDLAEFAAEIFHNLHEEVMVTAARGHGLVARVQQLEVDFPSIEKVLLSQTSHSPFFSARGVDWHPNLQSEQNLVTRGDLPRFVMDSYEECRGPPRLFLLDKYDVAGAGACLKRYTDPSFFKLEAKSNEVPTGDVQREKKVRKMKKKAAHMRNGEFSGAGPASHAKLHQLLMEERIENGNNNPARAVKLKKRHLNGYPFDSETGKGYMVQFVETPSPEHKVVHEVPVSPPRLKFRLSNRTSTTAKDVSDKSPPRNGRSCSPPYAPEVAYKPSIDDVKEVVDRLSEVVPVLSSDGETDETPSSRPEVMDKTIYAIGGEGGKEGSVDGYPSDDVTSEVDNYMDALTTMESEMETDNEHRVKNDLGFLNLEKYGMDSDAYEEPLEFQTVLADSQSIANSSGSANENGSSSKGISSISYSDTSSNLAENALSDGDRADRVSPSNEQCLTEFTDTPSNKLPTSEILESKSDELEVPNNLYIEEVKIPDTRETSPFNKLSTSEIIEPKSDRLEVPKGMSIDEVRIPDTRSTSCASAELVETLMSDCTQFGTLSSNGDSDGFSSTPFQNGDHTLFAVPDETYNGGGSGVTSDAPPQFSNISEGAHEKKSSDADMYLTENFDHGEISSAYLVSPKDELLCSALTEAEVSSVIKPVPASILDSVASYSDSLKLDDIVTEAGSAIPPTEVNIVNLAPTVDVPESRNPTEEQLSGIPDSVPQLDTSFDEISDTVDGQEIGRHRCAADDEEKEVVPLEVPCNHSSYADPEDQVSVDMITKTIQGDDVALSFASAANFSSSSSDIISSPGNLASSHECLSDSGDQYLRGLEFSEEISPGCFVESEMKQEMLQLEAALTDSDSSPKNSVSHIEPKLEVLDHAEDVSVTEQDPNSSHVGDVTTTSMISQLRIQVAEPVCPQPDDLLENSEDALPSSTSLQETVVPSQQFSRLQVDEVHIDNLKVDKEQLQSPILEDPVNHTTLSELSPQSADLDLDFAGKGIDQSYQPSLAEFAPQPSIHEADRTKQATGLEDSSLPNFGMHSVATQVSYSADSCPDNLLRQLTSSELLLPTGQGNQGTKQTVDQLDSGLPFFGSFPESTPDHLDMPPLPPLPPMQWRMGKVHNAPFPPLLGGSLCCSQDSNTIPSSGADEKVESGFLPEKDILQPQNPFVPLIAVEDEMKQDKVTGLDGNLIQHTPYSPQVSNMVNDLVGEVRHYPDSFLTSPTISYDRERHDFHTSGGEIAQSSYTIPLRDVGDEISGHDHVSSMGNPMQPLNQLGTETSQDAKIVQHASKDLGQGDARLQNIEDEQPQNGLPTSGGEISWYPKISATEPFFEIPKPNRNSTMKFPRPRSPLIDAVAAHDKSTLRKVTERSRPQIEPKVDERDSLLEQIRMKSFSLKPAVVTRPSIQGPKTNLKVAAILEKANAIRQALAGSDNEDDADSWSDS